jgi:hypothetical protein
MVSSTGGLYMKVWKWIIALSLALGASLGLAVERPLELALARYEAHYGRIPGHTMTGVIRVENPKALMNQKLWVRYTQDGKTWGDHAASFQGIATDGSEIWNFATPLASLDTPRRYRFALRLERGSEVFWDNNSQKDYRIEASSWPVPIDMLALLEERPIGLHDAFRYDGTSGLVGSIDVKNLGYRKEVKVRYTLDEGLSFQDVAARFAFGLPDRQTERWEFRIPLQAGQKIRFMVLMSHDGATYTDDNFGLLYESNSPGLTSTFH